jgi:hypothetical protein
VLAKQVLDCLSYTSSPLCSSYFGDGVTQTTCPGWPQTEILLISTSQVARITGMSHQCLTSIFFYSVIFLGYKTVNSLYRYTITNLNNCRLLEHFDCFKYFNH